MNMYDMFVIETQGSGIIVPPSCINAEKKGHFPLISGLNKEA